MSRYEIERVRADSGLSDAFAVRRAVFVDEQGVPADIEIDEYDRTAVHFLARDTHRGEPVGTARLRYVAHDLAKAERVAVLERYRGKGIGRMLMRRVESEARESDRTRMTLNAQTRVEEFYLGLGYETTSDVFCEAGIPHVEMTRQLDS
jgi:predicted GNAT family N-acyltransferase